VNATGRTVPKGVGTGTATPPSGVGAAAAKPLTQGDSIIGADSVPSPNGTTVDVDGTDPDGTDPDGDQADVVETNIEASNGVIHAIDGVLRPPDPCPRRRYALLVAPCGYPRAYYPVPR
jgi:hypothetical protein